MNRYSEGIRDRDFVDETEQILCTWKDRGVVPGVKARSKRLKAYIQESLAYLVVCEYGRCLSVKKKTRMKDKLEDKLEKIS